MTYQKHYVWGRYDDWGEIKVIHVVSLAIAFVLLLAVYSWISGYCSNKRRTRCEEVMSGRLRTTDDTMSKRAEREMLNLWQEQKRYKDELKPADPGKGDPGWELQSETHFNTSIATSYIALEEAVRSTRPDLRHRHFRTIREFVMAVGDEFPSVKEYCLKYIDMYELARFGNHRYTAAQYDDFLSLFRDMVKALRQTNDEM